MVLQGVTLEPGRDPKSIKNHTFGPRSARGPSKNDIQKGGGKKHEKLMKNQCKNWCFLMARNHVWRYTLRLFHTFALFEKNRKSMPKGRPKVIVCAGRRPPHPWEETGESVLVGRYLGNGENGEPGKKTIQNDNQNHQKSMNMGSKIHAKSMKSRGCVADAFWERFG